MSEGKLGMVVLGTADKVVGVITDGDLRRGLVKYADVQQMPITTMMNGNPIIVSDDMLVYDAEALMLERKITTLLVQNSDKQVTGVYQIFNQA
jgi:arabinose-5-phosphate isomerase